MDEQTVKGKKDQAVGTVKDEVGKATGDHSLEAKGKIQDATGKVREGVGHMKDESRREETAETASE